MAEFRRRIVRMAGVALTMAAIAFALPASASEGAKGGGNSCPWSQDVSLDIDGKTITLNQAVFTATGAEPTVIDGYQFYPLVDQLKLRVVGPRGREWEASLTRLVSGKRCSAFYVGKAYAVTHTDSDPNVLILNR